MPRAFINFIKCPFLKYIYKVKKYLNPDIQVSQIRFIIKYNKISNCWREKKYEYKNKRNNTGI